MIFSRPRFVARTYPWLTCLSLFFAASSISLAQPTYPSGFVTQLIADTLDQPTSFDFAAGNRIFIAFKDGRIRVMQNDIMQPTMFLDYRSQVNTILDRGLLSLAVHPEFPAEPYVYLAFTYDPPETIGATGLEGPDKIGNRVSRLVRVEADPGANYNIMLPGSEIVLIGNNSIWSNIGEPDVDFTTDIPSCDENGDPLVDCLPQDSNTHAVGDLKFGQDGSLYFTHGEGARASGGTTPIALRAQHIDSLAGKLMRINPLNGEAYASNPFFDGDFDSNRSKVWSNGLRNPFRMAVNPVDGELYIGDVGWGLWEEVNKVGVNTTGGLNFGWPCFEGDDNGNAVQSAYAFEPGCITLLSNGLAQSVTAPNFAYPHLPGKSSSIQMGDFYSGITWPTQYQGALFYSDINRQVIRYLTLDNNGDVTADNEFGSEVLGITQIRSGPDSNLYFSDIYNGEIRRILYTAGGNTPPTAEFTPTPLSGNAPLPVTFDASASFDPDADDLSYAWDFGDGTFGTGIQTQHTFTSGGDYPVRLTVTDTNSATSLKVSVISVGNTAPQAAINSILNGNGNTNYVTGDTIFFTGSATDPEDGAITGEGLVWNVRLRHNDHFHLDYFNGTGASGEMPLLDHEDNSRLEICLTAVDSGDLSNTTCQTITPAEINLTIQSIPSGLEVAYGDTSRITPFTATSPVGATRTLATAATQGQYSFGSWSDGGSRVRDFVIPTTDTTLVANFESTTNTPTLSISDASVNENDSVGVFTVTLSPPDPTSTVRASVAATTLGTGTPGQDYFGFFSTIEFLPGETTATVSVVVLDDFVDEPNETVIVRLFSDDADVTDSQGEMTIIDDDGSIPYLSIDDVTVDENTGTGSFTVSLNPPNSSAPVTVVASASPIDATPGQDYFGFSTVLTFGIGETSKTIDVTILNDSVAEGDEKLKVRIYNPSNAQISDQLGEMTIIDDDNVSISILSVNDVSVDEDAFTGSFTISLDAPNSSAAVTVRAAATPLTATPGQDYYGFAEDVTFAIGETQKTINVRILEDLNVEGDEELGVRLLDPVNALVGDGTGTMTIVDNDSNNPSALSIDDISVNESAGTGTFTVTLDTPNPNDTITVSAAAQPRTATAGSDFYGFAQTLSFAPGETTKTITVTVIDNNVAERTETMRVRLYSPSNATIANNFGVMTILDDD